MQHIFQYLIFTVFKEPDWGKKFEGCIKRNHSQQSPIDLRAKDVWNIKNPTKIEWRFFHHYKMYHKKNLVQNDGKYFIVGTKASKHLFSLSIHYGDNEEDVAIYYLRNIHIHVRT